MSNKEIWKFTLNDMSPQYFEMPEGFKVLTVQLQYGIPCLWVLVDSTAPKVRAGFYTFGTGHPVHDTDHYIGTYLQANDTLVWHVFQRTDL